MRLILLLFVTAVVAISVVSGGTYYSRFKGELYCNGHPIETWLYLDKEKRVKYNLFYYFTKFGLFDVTAKATHNGGFGDSYPGFLLKLDPGCDCGGTMYFTLPSVNEDQQYSSEEEADNHPFDFGKLEFSGCQMKKID